MEIEAEIGRIAQGDRAAFSRLYRDLNSDLIRYATALLAGDRESAEDAVDEAFIAIWEQAGRFDGRGHAMGWIRRIVRNKAIDWLRKQREVVLPDESLSARYEADGQDQTSPFEAAVQMSQGARLRSALSLLSVEHREAVWMCYFEEKSLAEIALIVQCPENTVKTRLFHARKQLRDSGMLQGAL